jgi:hypothetical protein
VCVGLREDSAGEGDGVEEERKFVVGEVGEEGRGEQRCWREGALRVIVGL